VYGVLQQVVELWSSQLTHARAERQHEAARAA
jgi:hypothetical protein